MITYVTVTNCFSVFQPHSLTHLMTNHSFANCEKMTGSLEERKETLQLYGNLKRHTPKETTSKQILIMNKCLRYEQPG